MMMRSVQVVCAVLLLTCACVHANPWRWSRCPVSASTNWGHPNSGHGHHAYIAAPDTGITMALFSGRRVARTYCPGLAYVVQVTLPELSQFTLTTSAGIIVGGAVCGGARINVPQTGSRKYQSKTYRVTLRVPKPAPSTIVLKVTRATSSGGAYRHNSLTIKKGKC